jgi:hypothetical protein
VNTREKRLKTLVEGVTNAPYKADGEPVERFARFFSEYAGNGAWKTHKTLRAARGCAAHDYTECLTTDVIVDLETGKRWIPSVEVSLRDIPPFRFETTTVGAPSVKGSK